MSQFEERIAEFWRVKCALEERCADDGVRSLEEAQILFAASKGGAITLSSLRKEFPETLYESTITRRLLGLAERGYLTMTLDPDDHRGRLYTIEPKGERALEKYLSGLSARNWGKAPSGE